MVTLFISGSRLANLDLHNIELLRECITTNIPEFDHLSDKVIVGDCSGIDTDIQCIDLNITVYHVGRVRNNPHGLPTYQVQNKGLTGREYYAQKDRVMADHCTHHIGLVRGNSQGTTTNHTTVLSYGKPSWLINI